MHLIQKPPQASSVLFSPSALPLRLLFAYVTLLPAPSAKLRMLVPLFSPNHLKKHTEEEEEEEEGGKKLRDRERLRGKKGAVQSRREVIFFPFISPPLFLSTPPYFPISFSLSLSLCLSPSPWPLSPSPSLLVFLYLSHPDSEVRLYVSAAPRLSTCQHSQRKHQQQAQ